MSICSSSIRALSRSRVSPSRTLLPFLYQTATLQQWRPAARRNVTSRSNDRDDIPFEDETLPPAIDNPDPARKTTITGSERAAFEKLYRTFNTRGQPKNDKDHVVELDQIADEYYEDDENNQSQSLDKVFDEVLKGEPRLRASRHDHGRPKQEKKEPDQDAQTFAEGTLSARTKKAQNKRKEAKAEAARIKELKFAERERVDKLLQNAQTDRKLWQILNREVLDQVRKLDLDGTKSGKAAQSSKTGGAPSRKSKPDLPATTDRRILFQNYSHHLITAIQTLRTAFPSSPLPHSILPTIKSLGRSSYALGTTTTLYKHLIRTAWLQQSSYTYIDSLLVDMNNGAIEFDSDILALLDAIIKQHDMARSGRLGREMQMVYGMEQFLEGIRKVRQWRGEVAERLGVVPPDERRVPQPGLVRAVDRWGKHVDPERLRGRREDSGGEADLEKAGTRENIPLVEEQGTGEAEVGGVLPKLETPQHVDAESMREAELLAQELGLLGDARDREAGNSGIATEKNHDDHDPLHEQQQATQDTVDTTTDDKPAKIIL
ncbi:hypothetical protein N0V83_002216 [Neocucurbitaria cava]|uniref:Mtf2-like C-terminal domain-containing protein n=1 Tax=Neocucurbitaria cava TaxID=798079 RepID=A0A9W8YDY0_9PLEO|nr:hypothetical protein N0V83_002216 [Neocucurbitaria cava]